MEEFKYSWGTNRRFNSYAEYFKQIYGGRIQKVSVNAGFTCPNRDGKLGVGGCTFCNNEAFNPSYCKPELSVHQQVTDGIDFHKHRYRRSKGYLVYFQAYTNTYADTEYLKKLYLEALEIPKVIGLVIGTRPDCISDELLEFLAPLSQKYFIIIEYGIESIYDKTLVRVNRGHNFECAVNAINKTAKYGLKTGAHIIFGLPGETIEEMMQSVHTISKLPLTNIKFHQLQIVKGTAIEKEYYNKPNDFVQFTYEEYIEFFAEYIKYLNPDFVLERFVNETPPQLNSGTQWTYRADEILRRFEVLLEERDIWQGMCFKPENKL